MKVPEAFALAFSSLHQEFRSIINGTPEITIRSASSGISRHFIPLILNVGATRSHDLEMARAQRNPLFTRQQTPELEHGNGGYIN
jgi:hypothetical protein